MAKRRKNNKMTFIVSAVAIVIMLIIGGFEKLGVTSFLNDMASPVTTTSNSSETDTVLMTASFIDVGQGDCTLFISDGETMLIDSGEAEYGKTVLDFLDDCGITTIDYVVATHAHTDHMGSMAYVIENTQVKNIILSEPCEASMGKKQYGEFLDTVNECNADIIMAEPYYKFTLGNAECIILAPFSVSDEENNNSVIMKITAGATSFLMTGDAEKAVEKELLAAYPNLEATILKVGHHGSKTSSHSDFIEQLNAEAAVISVGEDNSYNHPAEDILKILGDNGLDIYRTDSSGTVTVSCYADKYDISTER